jgi:hypothetical protein
VLQGIGQRDLLSKILNIEECSVKGIKLHADSTTHVVYNAIFGVYE